MKSREPRITDKIEYFDKAITNDEELFSYFEKKHSVECMVFIRYRHGGVEQWETATAHYNKYENKWTWNKIELWKIGDDFEYQAYMRTYEIEDFLCTYVQCVTESMED